MARQWEEQVSSGAWLKGKREVPDFSALAAVYKESLGHAVGSNNDYGYPGSETQKSEKKNFFLKKSFSEVLEVAD